MRQKVGRSRGIPLSVEKTDSGTALNTRFAENRRATPYSCLSIPQHLYLYLFRLSFSCSSLCVQQPRVLPLAAPSLFSPRGILVDTNTAGARSTRQRVLKGECRNGDEARGMKNAKEKKMKKLPNLTPFATTTWVYTFHLSLSVNLSWSRFPSVPLKSHDIDNRRLIRYLRMYRT